MFFEDGKSVTSIQFISIYKYNWLTEKAENFLYLVVKNHLLTDGNKRLAT
jgi:prophage maintenance system killer protein